MHLPIAPQTQKKQPLPCASSHTRLAIPDPIFIPPSPQPPRHSPGPPTLPHSIQAHPQRSLANARHRAPAALPTGPPTRALKVWQRLGLTPVHILRHSVHHGKAPGRGLAQVILHLSVTGVGMSWFKVRDSGPRVQGLGLMDCLTACGLRSGCCQARHEVQNLQ